MKALSPNRELTFKVVLVGDGTVGKTSIRRNYLGESFKTSHIATLGVDFAQKYVQYQERKVRLIIWDLAGQPSYESVRKHYYLGCSGIFFVYSALDRTTFDNASKWLVEAFKYMGKLPPTAIIANKIDLRNPNSDGDFITTEEGQAFAQLFNEKLELPAVFIETSAKTGENIQTAFEKMIKLMLEFTIGSGAH